MGVHRQCECGYDTAKCRGYDSHTPFAFEWGEADTIGLDVEILVIYSWIGWGEGGKGPEPFNLSWCSCRQKPPSTVGFSLAADRSSCSYEALGAKGEQDLNATWTRDGD